jgi:hypothetical protein
MSLAHLFDQPVVKPKPTRVVRGGLDLQPGQKSAEQAARNQASREWYERNKARVSAQKKAERKAAKEAAHA